MVLGTVSATNAASQQLRLDNITTKPLSSFNAFKNALPKSQHREHDLHLLWATNLCVSPAQPPCQSTLVSAEGSDTAANTAANRVAVTPTQA